MDPVSQALSTLRVGRGTVRRFRQSGSWGLRFSGLVGSGFHVVLRGGGWLLSADAPPAALRAGDLVLVTAGADHALSSAPRPMRGLPPVALGTARPDPGPADFEFLCGAYRLDHGVVHPFLAALPGLIVAPADRAIADLLDAHEAAADGPGADAVRPALLDLMLARSLGRWLETADRPQTPDPAITAVLRAVEDSPQTRWTVRDLSAAAGLSRAAFTRRFTAAVGRGPAEYLLGWRLDRAARLLREGDAPLASIARQVGYATEFSFSGAFRREYGVSPGRFRRAARTR